MRRDATAAGRLLLAGWLMADPAFVCVSAAAPRRAARGRFQANEAAQGSSDALASDAAKARDAGRLEEALGLYRKALASRADWDEGRWYVATLLYELDRYAEAREAFAEVLRHQPTHAGALGLKGLCEFELRNYERALGDLLEAGKLGVSRSPGISTVVRYHTAILLTRFGEFEVANQMLTELASQAAETPQVIEAFGINVLRMPVLPGELPPDARERVGLAGRAGYAMAARHMDAARIALDELIARYPSTPHAHYARGVFLLTENADRALEDFRRELELSPSHVPARLQIAFELVKRGEPARARTSAEEAARLAPDHFATRLALGQVLLEMNDVDEAIPELEKAVALAPESPQTHFMLAKAYARAGRTVDAERERSEFTRLDQLFARCATGCPPWAAFRAPGRGVGRCPALFSTVARFLRLAAAAPAGLLSRPGRRTPARTASPAFVELTPGETGIRWVHQNAMSPGRYLPETCGSGCAFIDFDNDGWMDIYLVNSGPSDFFTPKTPLRNALYKNNRDGTFTDVTEKAGVPGGTFGMGAAVGDYDNDGIPICS